MINIIQDKPPTPPKKSVNIDHIKTAGAAELN